MVTMVETVMVAVLCGGFIKQGSLKGRPCQKQVARIDPYKWETSTEGSIEIVCPRCGTVTRLRDFV
jgi:phage FluMu protein Com